MIYIPEKPIFTFDGMALSGFSGTLLKTLIFNLSVATLTSIYPLRVELVRFIPVLLKITS
jgi:hypothetical protein